MTEEERLPLGTKVLTVKPEKDPRHVNVGFGHTSLES